MATAPASSAALVTSSSVGARTVDAGRPASGAAACLSWPTSPSIAVPTAPARVGVRGERFEGFVAESLSVEIVTWTAGCFAHSLGVFLQECQHARASSPWAAFAHGPPRALARALRRVRRVGRNQFSFFMKNRNSFSFVFLS